MRQVPAERRCSVRPYTSAPDDGVGDGDAILVNFLQAAWLAVAIIGLQRLVGFDTCLETLLRLLDVFHWLSPSLE
jgi:hypothetical protein